MENLRLSYKQKLKDPRWQEKRLKILQRDKNQCRSCGLKKDLHVHHIKYFRNPWDVKDQSLITLCISCHNREESLKKTCSFLVNLSKDTNIPCVILNDLLFESLSKLNFDNIDKFDEYLNSFEFKRTKPIKKEFIEGREVKYIIGGRVKFIDEQQYG